MTWTVRARLKFFLRLAALAPAFALGLPAQWLALKLKSRAALWLPMLFHRYLCHILGVRIERVGEPSRSRPLLIVSNHVSWLDIIVLSAIQPVSFIAKSEVGTWPGVRTLARLQRSVFVERERRARTGAVNAEIAERLQSGDAMVLFGEGTTSDGLRVLPFRSAILGAVQGLAGAGPSAIQPLAIRYMRLAGLPIGRSEMAHIAWYGDMDLSPHLAELLTGPPIVVRVVFPPPVVVESGADRKALTRDVESRVRSAFETGRPLPDPLETG
jgi:1-acyl-sn-glycerol-3-phosphate acyltransferase